jgi:hypothetical protein
MAEDPIVFESRWVVAAALREVFDLLMDVEGLPAWLPCVVKEAAELPRDQGVRRARLGIRGLLPYTLRLDLNVSPDEEDASIRIESRGDLRGTGLWKLVDEEGGGTGVAFACSIHAESRTLRLVNRILWPLVALNHRWVMARVEARMRARLETAR